jgi:hypothetical protein
MANTLLKFEQQTYWQSCVTCGVWFGFTLEFENQRRLDTGWFYCPNGHPLHYAEGREEKVRREMQAKVDAANKRAEWEQAQARMAREEADRHKRALARQTKRVNAGVCPHCNRTFKQLAAHMKCKHSKAL